MNTHGVIVLFGSGETLDTGRKIQRNILLELPRNQRVAVLETPSGFQPNSDIVAGELAEVFETSLKEFIDDVTVIPARKKDTPESPDNEEILKPLETASYIVLGPGSPTYASKQLKASKALTLIKKKWQDGATVVLSSAAAMAFGQQVLPVYEIYKVGSDYYWEQGLDLFADIGLPLSILTHWDNSDGGEKLDTSHCFMGKNRFAKIYELFPQEKPLLCVDEHTAVIFYVADGVFEVCGKGNMTLLLDGQEILFSHGVYSIEALKNGEKKEASREKKVIEKQKDEQTFLSDIPSEIQELLEKRKQAKLAKDFELSDSIRKEIEEKGFVIEDIGGEQKVLRKE